VLAALEGSLTMIEFDTDGNVLWANDHFAQAMGYTLAELQGMHHRRFCSAEFAGSAEYARLWERLRGGHKFQEKIIRYTKDGSALWLEATYIPIFTDGRVAAVLKVATDITRREQATRRVTEELNQLAESLLTRTEQGIRRSRQVESTIERIVQENAAQLADLQALVEQSKSVQGIVHLIHDIASQTNLLGLNAAIEAAHAGDRGRGFGVVAAEVRKLAQQVQASATDIRSTVEKISGQIHVLSAATATTQQAVQSSQERIQEAAIEFKQIAEAASLLEAHAKTMDQWL
jgi:PAS domain S-box-containing protein